MLGFLKKILGLKSSDNSVDYRNGEKFAINDEKKNTLDNADDHFYVHTEPEPSRRTHMENESSTIKGGGNIDIYDQVTGKPISQDSISLEHVPDGINIPGLGFMGSAKQQKQAQRQGGNPQSIQVAGNNTIPVNSQMKNPPSEIVLTSEAYHLYVDLAGVRKETVKLTFTDSVLNVSGKRSSMIDEWKTMSKGKGRKHTIMAQTSTVPPILFGAFDFKYPFKKSVDETSISAEFSDGLLHVTLPLRAKSDGIAIAII